MPDPKPSELRGEALIQHLLHWGMAALGPDHILFLTPSGKAFVRRHPQTAPSIREYNEEKIRNVVTRFISEGHLHVQGDRLVFSEESRAAHGITRKSLSEAEVFKRIEAHANPFKKKPISPRKPRHK